MYVITEEGKIYEGLALTPEEAEIFEQLGEGPELNTQSESYISRSSSRKIAAYLCSNFILERRKPLEQEPELNSEEPELNSEEPELNSEEPDFEPERQFILGSSEIPQPSDNR